MNKPALGIGIVTDEVSRNLEEALQVCAEWGIARFELREGEEGRFPGFTAEEVRRIDTLVQHGGRITAVSPGIFKGHVEDRSVWTHEIESTTPRAIELAKRFECDVMIAFGFEECDDRRENRLQVLKAFEQVAEQAAGVGMQVAIENEPGFWIDRPEETISLLRELDHPALRLNWDPANLLWGGGTLEDAIEQLSAYIINLHVKDYTPEDEEVPWRPLGDGVVPWVELMPDVLKNLSLSHVTIETHCEPLIANSRKSLDHLLSLLAGDMNG